MIPNRFHYLAFQIIIKQFRTSVARNLPVQILIKPQRKKTRETFLTLLSIQNFSAPHRNSTGIVLGRFRIRLKQPATVPMDEHCRQHRTFPWSWRNWIDWWCSAVRSTALSVTVVNEFSEVESPDDDVVGVLRLLIQLKGISRMGKFFFYLFCFWSWLIRRGCRAKFTVCC